MKGTKNGDWGSSPLARGTHEGFYVTTCVTGLIPARAGNTVYPLMALCTWWAHPRSRGEHGGYETAAGKTPGSSPLARGTRSSGYAWSIYEGLIPARAGNTGG